MPEKLTRTELDRAMNFEIIAHDANAGAALEHFLGVLRLKHQWLIKLKFARDFKVDRLAYPYKPDGLVMAALLNLCEQIVAAYPSHFGGMNACQVFAAIWQEKAERLVLQASEGEIAPFSEEAAKSLGRFGSINRFLDEEPTFALELSDAELPAKIYDRLLLLTLLHIRGQRLAALAATSGKSSRNEFELTYWENPSRKAVASIIQAGRIPPFVNAMRSAIKAIRDDPKRQVMRSRVGDEFIELGRNVGGRGRGFSPLSKVRRKITPTAENLTQ